MDKFKFDRRREGVSIAAVTIVLLLASMAASAAAQSAYEKTIEPSEAMVGQWDFVGASAAMAKLKFRDKALTDRLGVRRDEIKRLAALKTKIIEKTNKLKPWLRRGPAVVPGSGGKKIITVGVQITKATEKTITVSKVTVSGKTSSHKPWTKLNTKELDKLLEASVSDNSADDQLAAGLLALVRADADTAETHFNKAKSLGVKIDAYLTPLAAAAFNRAVVLLEKGDFPQAGKALSAIEKKYASSPWMANHKEQFAAALSGATAGVKDASAEKLYRQAAKLYADKDLFALKTALDKLKSDFPNSQAVTDTNHDPSFATMSKAVANLGVLITVRQDGKGDCKTIREAVLSAPPKSVIEVQDSGTYHPGNITLKGSTLRGAKGKWPVLSGGKHGMVNINLSGEGCRVEGLVILDSGANYSININNKNTQKCRLRRLIIVKRNGWCHIPEDVQGTLLDGCLIIKSAPARLPGSHRTGVVTMRNCIWLNGDPESKAPVLFENCFLPSFKAGAPTEFERCTVLGNLTFPDTGGSVLNSIVGRITVTGAEVKIGFCNMLNKKPVAGSAKPDKTCFSIDPQFRNPAKYDYNLKPSSPCRRKGDGGKGVGCVYTPEMIQILKKALQLRKDKILKWDD